METPAVREFADPLLLSSMVSHYTPHFLETQRPASISSMIAHCVLSPPSIVDDEKLLSKEDFLELWKEHQEQVKKDWAEIMSKLNNLNINLAPMSE